MYMKKSFNKSELETDVGALKDELAPFISDDKAYKLFDKRNDLKKELEEEKKTYASISKLYKKKNRIKNLVVTARVSLFLIPIVLVPGIIGGVGAKELTDDYTKNVSLDASYVEECVYLDNFGNQVSIEEARYDDDFLLIETAYEKMDSGSYIGKTYTFDKDVHFIEEMREYVNTDYTELLNELEKPDSTNTMIKESIDEEKNKTKVSMVAKVYKKVEEKEAGKDVLTGKELYKKHYNEGIKDGALIFLFFAGFGAGISCLLAIGLDNKFEHRLEKVKREVGNYIYDYKESKTKIKELKKEIKKLGGK